MESTPEKKAEPRYRIKPLKGFDSIVAYNTFSSLMLTLHLSTVAYDLIKEQVLNGETDDLTTNEQSQLMWDNLRLLPDDSHFKKLIWLDLLKVSDKDSPEYLHLFKICEDINGISITAQNIKNYEQEEVQQMLYDAFCACLNHGSNVFF